MGARQVAIDVFRKLENSPKVMCLGVFISVDRLSIRTTKPTTQLFDEAIRKTPNRFVGVYDGMGSSAMIEEDLIDAGMAA